MSLSFTFSEKSEGASFWQQMQPTYVLSCIPFVAQYLVPNYYERNYIISERIRMISSPVH